MVQTEDCGHINPVPAIKFLARLSQFFSLSPVVALADIPGVNLDDQSEALGGWPLGSGTGYLLNLLPGVELGDELGAQLLGVETLAVGFLMQPATGQIQPQALGHQHRLFGGHLADQQRRDFLHVRRGGGFAAQAQGMVGRKVPLPTAGTPTVAAPDR